jgi:hypothetical protein
MKTDTWLKKALAPKNDPHESLHSVFALQGRLAASNGKVVYLAEAGEAPALTPKGWDDTLADYLTRPLPTTATVTTDPLLHAARAAKAVEADTLRLTLNGAAIVYAKGPDAETTWTLENGSKWELRDPIHYTKTGPDADLALSPKYLRDALSGMGETVTVELGKDFARIADGARIAVIMGMHTG